jgi:DNA-binding winged helix-turn-helix (wHTH) protein
VVSENGTRAVRFGIFELDLRAGELRRNGSKVRLQEQPFQVLTVLLARPGEVVTREELQKKLWPADTFVDFDHSLNAAIRRLRDALGDSAENPRFVETVARRGYRFLAPLNGAAAPAVIQPTPQPTDGLKRWHIFATGALLLVGVVVGWVVSPLAAPTQPSPVPPDQTAAAYGESRGRPHPWGRDFVRRKVPRVFGQDRLLLAPD